MGAAPMSKHDMQFNPDTLNTFGVSDVDKLTIKSECVMHGGEVGCMLQDGNDMQSGC